MNSAQVKYAVARANDTYQALCAKLTAEATTPGVTLSESERATALRAGDFTISEGESRYDRYAKGHWFEAARVYITFKGETGPAVDPALTGRLALVGKERERTMDAIMLGEEEVALKALQDFAAGLGSAPSP